VDVGVKFKLGSVNVRFIVSLMNIMTSVQIYGHESFITYDNNYALLSI